MGKSSKGSTSRSAFRLREDEKEALERIAKKNNTNKTEQIRRWIKDNSE